MQIVPPEPVNLETGTTVVSLSESNWAEGSRWASESEPAKVSTTRIRTIMSTWDDPRYVSDWHWHAFGHGLHSAPVVEPGVQLCERKTLNFIPQRISSCFFVGRKSEAEAEENRSIQALYLVYLLRPSPPPTTVFFQRGRTPEIAEITIGG